MFHHIGLWLLIVVILSGCTIITERTSTMGLETVVPPPTETHHHYTWIIVSPPPPEPLPVIPPQGCGPYILPDIPPPPGVPDLTDPQYQTFRDVERALGEYIVTLREYIATEHGRITESYLDYRLQCDDE